MEEKFQFKEEVQGKVHEVFDGYPTLSLKGWERWRRCQASSDDVKFDGSTVCLLGQKTFLSNTKNKESFITLLSKYFRDNSIEVLQGDDDADHMIEILFFWHV